MTSEKCHYTIVHIENYCTWNWCYSAKQFEQTLQTICRGRKLLSCMVALYSYLEAVPHPDHTLDLSYLGGNTLLIFDGILLELNLQVEGMIRYRISNPWDMKIRRVYDYPPSDMLIQPLYYDIKNDFALHYEGRMVCDVKITPTNTWAFPSKDWDEQRATAAAKNNNLPTAIHFILNDEIDFVFLADSMEGYAIELKPYTATL